MAIREMLGTDDFPLNARMKTWRLLGKGILPAVSVGDSSASASSFNIDGRMWINTYALTNPRLGINLITSGMFTVDEIKTKAIYGGFRYKIYNKSTLTASQAILQFSSASNFIILTENQLSSATDEVYIKFMIDVPNGTVKAWVDGVLKATLGITASAISTAGFTVYYGSSAAPTNNIESHCFTDFYWEIDDFVNDGIPAGKLGPVKIRTVKTEGSVMGAGWSTTDNLSLDAVLNTPMSGTAELTPSVTTSADESVSTIGFARPDSVLGIKAVSMGVYHYRQSGTTPVLKAQLKQGSVSKDAVSFNGLAGDLKRQRDVDNLGVMHVDLNGKAWTNDSVRALKLAVNSKTGA